MARKIKLKIEQIDGQEFSYSKQLISLSSTGPGGQAMSAAEMFEAFPIIQKLKNLAKAQDYVFLEDAEWQFVLDRVEAAKYPMFHEVWIDFILAVRDAEKVQLTEVVPDGENNYKRATRAKEAG